METTWQKIKRNYHEEGISRSLVRRGIREIFDRWRSRGIEGMGIEPFSDQKNYLGIEGMNVYQYVFTREAMGDVIHEGNPMAYFVDFPQDSHLEITMTNVTGGEERGAYGYSHFPDQHVLTVAGAIAEIVGPTTDKSEEGYLAHFPNNGCWIQGVTIGDLDSLLYPFRETKPPGERRGAFGITYGNKVVLLEDSEKWEIINDNFRGYKALIGTSFYMLSEDEIQDEKYRKQTQISKLSYLVNYEDGDGEKRMGYFRIHPAGNRVAVKRALDNHMDQVGATSYRAVELEYNGSGCVVRIDDDQAWSVGNDYVCSLDSWLQFVVVRDP